MPFLFRIIAVAIAVLSCPVLLHAGEYVLTDRSDSELCREYRNNLNSIKGVFHPMVCERKLNPKFTDFKRPKWKKLDPWKYKDLVREVEIYLVFGCRVQRSPRKNELAWYKNYRFNDFKREAKRNKIFISLARFDIYNEGIERNVIKYEYQTCHRMSKQSYRYPPITSFVVVNDDLTEVTMNIYGCFWFQSRSADFIIYKGRSFKDYYRGFGEYRVAYMSRNKNHITCQLMYKDNKPE